MDPEWVGYVAAILTTAAYVPQALKVWHERNTKSISLGMYSMITTGIGIWFIYGVMIDSPSLMLANGICFALAGFILVMKLRLG